MAISEIQEKNFITVLYKSIKRVLVKNYTKHLKKLDLCSNKGLTWKHFLDVCNRYAFIFLWLSINHMSHVWIIISCMTSCKYFPHGPRKLFLNLGHIKAVWGHIWVLRVVKINLMKTKLAPNRHPCTLLRRHYWSWILRHATNILRGCKESIIEYERQRARKEQQNWKHRDMKENMKVHACNLLGKQWG